MIGNLLTSTERALLQGIADDKHNRLRRRAALILLYDEGKTTQIVSREIGLSPSQTRFWKQQFTTHGLGIVHLPVPSLDDLKAEEEANDTSITKLKPPLHFPEAQKNVGLSPDDTIAEAGRKILLFQFSHMLSHEAGTRLGEDIEELHDMRVATRKMRSAFFVFGDVYQPKITQFYQKELRKVGRALGRVRDLDVLIANGQGFQKSQPPESKHEIGPLLTYWELELGENRHGLLELLDHPRYLKFKESFNEFLQTPGLGIQTQDSSTANQLSRHIVPTLIYTRLANVMSYDSRISMATIPELHALRIECKLLRYTLEFFKEILGAEVLEFIAEIKKIQDHLGELNDAQVACQLMAAFLERFEKQQAKVPLNERSSPSGVVAYQSYCYGIRHQKMRTFPEVWESFKRIELRQRLARSVSVL